MKSQNSDKDEGDLETDEALPLFIFFLGALSVAEL
jgi:hypothetical protein